MDYQASAKHTPGPWRASNSGVWAGGKFVASVYGDDAECKPDARMQANAYLIAAAPEMFDVLEAIVRTADGRSLPGNLILDETCPLIVAARDILAKATGSAA